MPGQEKPKLVPGLRFFRFSYSYNVLGDLTGVTQGSQTRTFVYDSLKRLTSAANPESGTVTYAYDNNGNLTTKTDPRTTSGSNWTTTFAYDALNRLVTKTYSNDGGVTPPVNYYYDNASLPSGAPSFTRGYSTGRLVAVTYGTSSSNGDYRGYDELGRVVRQYQQTDGVNYLTEATYYLNSAMATETYPSVPGASDRRTVSYSLDSAARLSSLSSAATSYAAAASLTSITYKAHGALESETLGNSLIHQMSYNTRLQTTAVKLGTSGNPTSVLDLAYTYGTTDNNGNVKTHVNTIGSLVITDTISYDSLNRISSTVETTTSGNGWTETNGYDRYGNRWVDLGGGNQNLTFSTTTNRITTSGYTYDSAGNLTSDGTNGFGYDAENHLITLNSTSGYKYDGEGRRVRKLIGENTRFIYGISGELVAEFNGSNGNLQKEYVSGGGMMAVIDPSSGTKYTITDHLGSPRVVTDASANVVSRHDYMPFGIELGAGTAGRTTGLGYGASDGVRDQFTGQQRDTESGLDYFNARYYSSSHGRFTSTDPLLASGSPHRPQTWNRYAYVLNNPLKLVDPTGMSEQRPSPGDSSLDLHGHGGGALSSMQSWQMDETLTDSAAATSNESVATTLGLHEAPASEEEPHSGAESQNPQEPSQQQNPITVQSPNVTRTMMLDGKGYPVFGSTEEAAIAALQVYNSLSIHKNREYCVAIFETISGQFSFTAPTIGSWRHSTVPDAPEGTTLMAIAHTHGAKVPRSPGEEFSRTDKRTANNLNVPNYVATPSSRIMRFDPVGVRKSIQGTITVLSARAQL